MNGRTMIVTAITTKIYLKHKWVVNRCQRRTVSYAPNCCLGKCTLLDRSLSKDEKLNKTAMARFYGEVEDAQIVENIDECEAIRKIGYVGNIVSLFKIHYFDSHGTFRTCTSISGLWPTILASAIEAITTCNNQCGEKTFLAPSPRSLITFSTLHLF